MDVESERDALLQFVNATILGIFIASRVSESRLPCCEVRFNVLRRVSQNKGSALIERSDLTSSSTSTVKSSGIT